MKKTLFLTIVLLCIFNFSTAQKNTTLNIKFENFKDSVIRLSAPVSDGIFISNTVNEYILERKDGDFHFNFDLKNTTKLCIYTSSGRNGLLFVPGVFTITINPGDSLNFTLRDGKEGLVNMEISGRGADKLLIAKEVIKRMYSNYLFEKPYHKQNITERYMQVDRFLEVIDSAFNEHPKRNTRNFRLAKAQLVDQTLDAILSQSVQQYNDSIGVLFKKFILDKKRIDPLLDSLTIDFFGGFHVLPDYIYMLNRKQLGKNYDLFRYNYPLEYAALVQKEFKSFPFVRDYLMSDNTMSIFRENWYSQKSKEAYKFYVNNVNRSNPHFKEVTNEFNLLKNELKAGKQFYNFNLPDTNGIYHRLKDFKGKVVILDFWFTGCGACKTLVPGMSKIESSLQNEKVQFVSINVDKDKATWKNGIGVYSVSNSLQLFTEGRRYDHPIIDFGKVKAFPTLIVLDKEGRIVGIPPHPVKDPKGFMNYIKACM